MSPLLASTTISHSLSFISSNPLRRTTNTSQQPKVHGRVGVSHISCIHRKTNPKDQSPNENSTISVDRRNVLVGLGGLYGATAATQAIGAPIAPPDLSKCGPAIDDVTHEKVSCCPPYPLDKIIDFVPPSTNSPLRVRKPAHKYPAEELAKFEAAITKMKNLPADDPWNYWQQATIHCTFCNGSFNQAGSSKKLQIHGSWLFLPWHRCYLYFWEKILGKLIDDPTFAVPFWNWDTKDGMTFPEIYWKNKNSPLYDSARNESHYKTMIEYYEGDNCDTPKSRNPDYKGDVCDKPKSQNPDDIAFNNYTKIYRDFTEGAHLSDLFMGKPLKAGDEPSASPGSCESLHGLMHEWVGADQAPFYNMGNFVTAAKDTIFFGHHGNVDRMWDLYTKSRGNIPEFDLTDWLDSAFIFVDENHDVVKIKVRDCLKPEQLRYTYSDEPLPWKNIGRKFRRISRAARKRSARGSSDLVPVYEFGSTPRTFKEAIRALVRRPKASRSKDEKEAALEVIVIDDIVTPPGMPAKLDVYIAKPIEGLVGSDYGDLAGSYVLVAHSHSHRGAKSQFLIGITSLLEDIDAEGSENLVVTLVPRFGEVTVGGVLIELREVDDSVA